MFSTFLFLSLFRFSRSTRCRSLSKYSLFVKPQHTECTRLTSNCHFYQFLWFFIHFFFARSWSPPPILFYSVSCSIYSLSALQYSQFIGRILSLVLYCLIFRFPLICFSVMFSYLLITIYILSQFVASRFFSFLLLISLSHSLSSFVPWIFFLVFFLSIIIIIVNSMFV